MATLTAKWKTATNEDQDMRCIVNSLTNDIPVDKAKLRDKQYFMERKIEDWKQKRKLYFSTRTGDRMVYK